MVNQKTTTETLDEWQTILSEINLKFIPTEYIVTAKLIFENGKILELDLSTKSYPSISHLLEDVKEDFDEAVVKMGFDINIDKVKRDVSEETTRLFAQM